MKITKKQLRQIIEEEVHKVLMESEEEWTRRHWENYANDEPDAKFPPSAEKSPGNQTGYRRHPDGAKAEEAACLRRKKLRGGISDCWWCASVNALIFHEPRPDECTG